MPEEHVSADAALQWAYFQTHSALKGESPAAVQVDTMPVTPNAAPKVWQRSLQYIAAEQSSLGYDSRPGTAAVAETLGSTAHTDSSSSTQLPHTLTASQWLRSRAAPTLVERYEAYTSVLRGVNPAFAFSPCPFCGHASGPSIV